MSAPVTGPNTSETKPKTITKFKRRLSRILKKEDVKGDTQAGPSAAGATGAGKSSLPVIPSDAQPEAVTKPIETSKSAAPLATKTAAIPIRPKPALNAEEHAKAQEEKVRALFAKYNVTLEVGEWTPPFKADLPRVEKKIRMRVHRTCHRCRTQFGVDKVCRNCTHNCCKKCPRYPLKKVEQQQRPKEPAGAAAVKPDTQYVKKPVTQRTRMICHECKTPFKSKSKECANCKHERCSQCQRSSSKGDTLAGGGAGSAPAKSFIKWTCHECDNVHRDPENPCLKCGHGRCDQCKKEKVSRGTSKPTESSSKVKQTDEPSKAADLSSQATAA